MSQGMMRMIQIQAHTYLILSNERVMVNIRCGQGGALPLIHQCDARNVMQEMLCFTNYKCLLVATSKCRLNETQSTY